MIYLAVAVLVVLIRTAFIARDIRNELRAINRLLTTGEPDRSSPE